MVSYRRSKKVGPFRITASKSGLGVSAGAGPLRLTRSAKGQYSRTVRVPGTGIYDTARLGSGATQSSSSGASQQPPNSPQTPPPNNSRNFTPGCLVLVALIGLLIFALAQCGGDGESSVSPAPTTSDSSSERTTTPSSRSTATTATSSTVPVTQSESAVAPVEPPQDQEAPPAPVPTVDVPVVQDTAIIPPPPPQPVAPPVAASFSSCAEARAAGAAPLYVGQPGYSTKLDRDRDGVACE
ncbi:hypothetical protein ABIE38_002618 [Dietzia sp. 2505]|uniref:DUF4236 domain-containing protein n=1 Tax=Dietzia sp. 2505 TaxID=3156457 RepID=UPI00339A1E1E